MQRSQQASSCNIFIILLTLLWYKVYLAKVNCWYVKTFCSSFELMFIYFPLIFFFFCHLIIHFFFFQFFAENCHFLLKSINTFQIAKMLYLFCIFKKVIAVELQQIDFEHCHMNVVIWMRHII